MFIKLTRLDNTPIWLNASFIVTVEPRRLGGATVVPIGDGLDYDVRETPERVLELLAGAPVPAVVPVPTSDALTPTPEDVSPESGPAEAAPEEPAAKPARKTTRTRKTKTADGTAAGEEPKATKKPRTTRRTKKSDATAEADGKTSEPSDAASAEPPPAAEPAPVAAPAEEPAAERPVFESSARATLSDEQVERLRRMAPGSVRKLRNTLFAQFRVADADAEIQALELRGVLSLERDHVNWAR